MASPEQDSHILKDIKNSVLYRWLPDPTKVPLVERMLTELYPLRDSTYYGKTLRSCTLPKVYEAMLATSKRFCELTEEELEQKRYEARVMFGLLNLTGQEGIVNLVPVFHMPMGLEGREAAKEAITSLRRERELLLTKGSNSSLYALARIAQVQQGQELKIVTKKEELTDLVLSSF